MPRIAIIGLGARISGVFAELMQEDASTQLVAVVDPNRAGVMVTLNRLNIPVEQVKIYDSVPELLAHVADFDAVMIGTRCHLHTPIAVQVAATGLPLFLEKPVAITFDQYHALRDAFAGREDEVVVSFPLRNTPILRSALQIIQSGRLGTINQVQAINNVPYGGVYFGQWYRNYDQVGGLWLQKATHDFDYINLLVGSHPTTIAATTSQKVYGGSMPHDLWCSKCDLTETCMESPKNIRLRGDAGGMADEKTNFDHACAFSREIKNEDAGSAIILYENGVHVSYSQNFITRRSAGFRGATITGYTGTLQFNWPTESIKVIDHHTNRVDNITIKPAGGHDGGDGVLARNFLNLIKGKEKSSASLHDGLLSAAMCLAARESSTTQTFQTIKRTTAPENSTPAKQHA